MIETRRFSNEWDFRDYVKLRSDNSLSEEIEGVPEKFPCICFIRIKKKTMYIHSINKDDILWLLKNGE